MVRISGKIRRLLVDGGLVSDEEWASARERGGSPVATLLSQGTLAEESLFEVLGAAAGIAPVDLSQVRPDPRAVEVLSKELCQEHGILPLTKNDEVLTIAVSDPFDVLLLDDLRRLSRCQVRTVLSHPAAIKAASEALFDSKGAAMEGLPARERDRQLKKNAYSVSKLLAALDGVKDLPSLWLVTAGARSVLDGDAAGLSFSLQYPGSHGHVIEDAVPFSSVWEGMVGSAR